METKKVSMGRISGRDCSVDHGSIIVVRDFLRSQTHGTCLLTVYDALPVFLPVRLGLRIPNTLLHFTLDFLAMGMGTSGTI